MIAETSQTAGTTASDRHCFLAEASRILAESLDYEETLQTAAQLAVPAIADWCSIDLCDDAQQRRRIVHVASAHGDPDRQQLAAALHENPPAPDARYGSPLVIRTSQTEYLPVVSESLLAQRESDPERYAILKRLQLHATVCTPLVARGRTLGALTLSTALGRQLTIDDVGTAEDLARRTAVAIDNARLYEDAQRAVRAREEVLAIVTHDLRAPLSAVVTAASLLAHDAMNPDSDRIRQRGETIQRSAQHMLRLVTDLTDLARIDSGGLTLASAPDDPVAVMREVRDALAPVVTRRGGTLRVQTTPPLPRTPFDRDRLRQVLANLVGNASKAGASEISVGATVTGADLVFRVEDNGPGIPPEDLPRMFDRHWRGRSAQYTGSGLGLPIANGIVRAHGGRMWIESTVGAGSTFFFSIPR